MSWGLVALLVALTATLVVDLRGSRRRTVDIVGLAPFVPAAVGAAIMA